jgi:hypothetical protein
MMAAAAVTAALLTAGGMPASAAPVDESGEVARTSEAVAQAAVPVPLPDLGLAARRGDGGIALFRMPLSELEDGFGTPQAVRGLPASAG